MCLFDMVELALSPLRVIYDGMHFLSDCKG